MRIYSARTLGKMIRMGPVTAAGAVLFCALARFDHAATPPERSVSSSRQFVVYGDDVQLRGAICEVAERCKQEALHLLGTRDEWLTPIIIRAQSPPANLPGTRLAQLHVNQTGHGLKFQLDLRLAQDASGPEVERELLRAILLEIMYRSQPDTPVGTAYVEPPDWLLDGMLALATESNSIASALATAAAGEVLTLEKLLRQKRALLDSPSQTLYRAYSAVLVSMLVESPEGRSGLARFVTDLPQASNDPVADLAAHFPRFGDDLEKPWQAAILRLAGGERYRVLGCEESGRQLAELLHVNVRAGNQTAVYGLEEFPRFVRDRAAAPDLQRLLTGLLLLSARAHPIYRPVMGEYQQIVARLARGKAPKVSRLAELRATREQLSRRMDVITDYMNWFEATQASTASGAFRHYLRAAELAQEPVPRRRDRISVYLDALETQF